MTLYAYRCGRCDDGIDREFPMGEAEAAVTCPCGGLARRDYTGVRIANDDQFRRFDLSTKKESEMQRQQRRIGGPRDKFEARHMERELGRKYIGDDAAELKPSGQRAVSKWKERVKNGEVKA